MNPNSAPVHPSNPIIAIVGGDRREQEIARLAVATGATVRAFGFPFPAAGIQGVSVAGDAGSALQDAWITIFPLPGMKEGCLYAPGVSPAIRVDEPLLRKMSVGGHVFSGTVSDELDLLASRLGLHTHAYEHHKASRVLRVPAIVEGAIARIVENTDITIHKAVIGVVGHGVVGAALTRALYALGALVTVVARDPVQRADAALTGASAIDFPALSELLPKLDILVTTVPHRLIDAAALQLLSAHAVGIDLASPPGCIDQEAAARLGRRTVWARGLGAVAPVTVGRAQWTAISDLIERLLRERS
jgi:dipicolinate synthase subunit A